MDKDRNYFEFVECFKQEVQNYTKNWNVEVKFCPAGKEQNEGDSLFVDIPMSGGKGIQHFDVEKMYQELIDDRENMESILNKVRYVLDTCFKVSMAGIIDEAECYEKISKHLILRPLNYDNNKEKLSDGVYYCIGDVALVLYISIGNIEGNYASCMARRELLSIWEKNKDEVMEAAILNTLRLFPPRVFDIYHIRYPGQPCYYEFMQTVPCIMKDGRGSAIYMTTENEVNGAIAVFMPGVARRLAELIGNDFYVGFVNIDVAVIHDCSTVTPEQIRETLRLNCRYIAKENYLSGEVYLYSCEQKQFRVLK
ncbi:DUF5688 family protein (plasmid) [Enterocloster clostridioformis]